MAMHRTYGPKDEQDQPVGDLAFIGVDERGDPRHLTPGMAANATNKEFADGVAATRPAFVTPVWGGNLGVSFDDDFNGEEDGLNFDPDGDTTEEGIDFEPCGHNETFGELVFSDPYGNEALLIACRNGVWSVRNYAEPQLIRLPDKEEISYPVWMIQCFDRVLMLRGEDRTILEWNPALDFEDGTASFVELTQTGSGTFTELPPNTEYGFSFANRAFFLEDRDTLVPSDILDYTRCDSTLNNLRINAGTDDAIIACVPGKDNRVLVGKRRSFYVLDGVFGTDLGYTATAQEVTRERGLIGRKAIVDMGAGEWAYLSDGGIYTIRMTDENKLRSSPEPLSWPIKNLMARVHWPYASGAILQVHEERLYCAIPLDGATGNNAILVYDLTTKKWQGRWTADYLRVVGMPIVTEHGQKRLCILNGTGQTFDASWTKEVDSDEDTSNKGVSATVHGVADGAIMIVDDAYADFLYGWTAWIEDELITRGYGVQTLSQANQLRLTADVSTWNPRFSIYTRRGGVAGESTVVEDVRRGFEVDAGLTAGTRLVRVGYVRYGFEYVFEADDTNNWSATILEINGQIIVDVSWIGAEDPLVDYLYTTVSKHVALGGDGAGSMRLDVIQEKEIVASQQITAYNGSNVIYPNGKVPLYRDYRFTGMGSSWLEQGDGWSIQIYVGVPGPVFSHSRRQTIYSAPEVLWEEGVSRQVIEAEGYDDYAWRLGAGIPDGITLGRLQRRAEVYRIRKRGDFVQARIANERGRMIVHGTQVDGIVGRRGLRGRTA